MHVAAADMHARGVLAVCWGGAGLFRVCAWVHALLSTGWVGGRRVVKCVVWDAHAATTLSVQSVCGTRLFARAYGPRQPRPQRWPGAHAYVDMAHVCSYQASNELA